ncbi:MAG: PD-(D/E)XK nuclease family protein, partial [Rhodospirillaceae bacterium]
ETGHVTVWDHKTTRSPRYMKTEDGLWNDPQCLVYLYAVRHLGTSFTFGHHYVRTDRPSAPTFVTVDKTLEQVEEGWEKFVGMTQGMAAVVASGQRPDGNTDACWEYGGCPFRERCNNAGDFSFLYPPAPSAVESTTPMPSIFDPPSTAFSPGEIVAGCIFVYVDCSPMADPPPSFATWVRPLVEKYEAIKHVHPLVEAYQAGIRAVALEAAREWERAPVPLLVASADPIGQLFATLLPASYVVRRLG